jgi:hypothetical protein
MPKDKLKESSEMVDSTRQGRESQVLITSRQERLAQEAEKQLQQLEKELATSLFPVMARQKLAKYAAKVAQQPELMNYFKQKNVALSSRIESLAKSNDRSRDRGISR